MGHYLGVEWAQVATIIAAITGVMGLQSFWVARALDALGQRLDRIEERVTRIEARLDRLEGREPPSLRSV